MKLADRWKAYRKIVEVPSPSDKLGDEMADLLDECEMLIGGLECRCDGMNRCAPCVTMDKLRAKEN